MFGEGSEKLHSKSSFPKTRKHQNAISMCSAKGKKRALQKECFEKGSRKTLMSES